MAHQLQHSSAGGIGSSEFGEQSWHPLFPVILAVVLVLPAVGMIIEGFSHGRLWVGLFGSGLFLALGTGYLVVAWLVFSRGDETFEIKNKNATDSTR
jgi:hypothetical protein